MRSEEHIGHDFGVIVAGSAYPPGFKAKCGVARRVVEGGIKAMCPECEIGCYIFHIVLTLDCACGPQFGTPVRLVAVGFEFLCGRREWYQGFRSNILPSIAVQYPMLLRHGAIRSSVACILNGTFYCATCNRQRGRPSF